MKRYFYILSLAFGAFCPSGLQAQSETLRKEISPLLKSEWGQQAPFYFMTPTIDGEHAKTGCVATALSQVIYYHRHPYKGKDGIYTNTGSTGDFSFDFGNNTFDYDLMKDKYELTTPETDASALEVSKLMLAAGVTVDMNYGISSSSGTFSRIPPALSEWFLYPSDGMGQLSKEYFTTEEWGDVIYEELAAGRPVLYLGGNGISSHVFVCDGYKDGKFHMNWGWYGEKNGYFNLSNLQTERVGDGTILSLNSGQRIVRGVRLQGDPTPGPLATASTFSYDPQSGMFTLENVSCFSYDTGIIPGISINDKDGKPVKEVWASEEMVMNRKNSNIVFSVNLDDVENGAYILRPVYRLNASGDDASQIHKIYCNILNTRYFSAKIADNAITEISGGTDIEVSVDITDFYQYSSFIKNEIYNSGFSIFAENTGNANITRFGVRLCAPGTTETIKDTNYPESLAPGESKTIALGLPTADPGEYDLIIYDNTTKIDLGSPVRIIIHDGAKIQTIESSSFRYMPLSEEKAEATILSPNATATASNSDAELEIEPTVTLNGKEYKITEIGPRLLYGRKDISKLVISENVSKIDPNAFAGCSNLSDISVNASYPPVVHPSSFDANTVEKATLHVPAESVELYKEAPVWSGFTYAADDDDNSPGSLSMPGFSIVPGDYFNATVNLETNSVYYGCQFNLTVPSGLQIVSGGVTVTDDLKAKNFTVGNSGIKADNSYSIVMYSANNTPYPNGDNTILDIRFLADNNFKGGTISISDILFSEAGEDGLFQDVKFEDTTSPVTVEIETDIDGIAGDNELADIYNVAGILVIANVNPTEAMPFLTPGLYIVKTKGKSYKILKR